MVLQSPDELAKHIINAGLATSDTIIGCTESEITQLERRLAVRLPAKYKDFLRSWGKQAGDFLGDCCFLYDSLESICRPHAESLAKKHGFELSPQSFVFLDRYPLFMFFDTTQGEDPPVWLFDEDQSEPKLIASSFLEWLNKLVDDELSA